MKRAKRPHLLTLSALLTVFLIHTGVHAFTPEFDLYVGTDGEGKVKVDPPGGPAVVFFNETYTLNEEVTLTAEPNAGWEFSHWEIEGGFESPTPEAELAERVLGSPIGTITDNPVVITMDNEHFVTAYFNELPANGTIIIEKIAQPGDRNIDFSFTGDISGSLKAGESFEVSDLEPGQYVIEEILPAHWDLTDISVDDDNSIVSLAEGKVTFVLDPDETIRATFTNTLKRYPLAIDIVGQGTVTPPPPGASYDAETVVALSADPAPNWVFDGWSGDLVSGDSNTSITMDGPKSVTANFRELCSLTVTSTHGGYVACPGEGTFYYDCGEWVFLQAIVTDPLYRFKHWNGSLFAGTDAQTFVQVDDHHHTRAVFECLLDRIYVNDDAPLDPAPYDANISDPNENGSPDHPFDNIQEAITVARPGAMIVVAPGTYWETIRFPKEPLTITGLEPGPWEESTPWPIIHGNYEGPVVAFRENKDPNTTLTGFVITGGIGQTTGGIHCYRSHPTLSHCLIVGNRSLTLQDSAAGLFLEHSHPRLVNCSLVDNRSDGKIGAGLYCENSHPILENTIVYHNQPRDIRLVDSVPTFNYCDIGNAVTGIENLNSPPLFLQRGSWASGQNASTPIWDTQWTPGNYHLHPGSPCIDAGDPNMPVGEELPPHGDRINMGAYGGTREAAKTQ